MVVALEVSNILDTVTSAAGTQAYRLGTRNTSTTLQVHDGETNVLAGLIQKQDQGSNTGLPWLNEIPLLGKLFGAAQDTNNRTEIVLLITPHIVRNIEPPGLGLQEFTSGTDASLGAAPVQLGTPWQAPAGNGSPGRPGASYYQPDGTATSVPNAPRSAGVVAPLQVPASPRVPASAPATPGVPPAFTAPALVPSTPGT